MERGGRTVKGMLQKSDVLPNKRCWDDRCPICKTDELGNCNKENIGYSIICQTCWESEENKDKEMKIRRHIMDGESSRTARIRCIEHMEALERKKDSNLWEHVVDTHEGKSDEVSFGYKVERKFHRDLSLIHISEPTRPY